MAISAKDVSELRKSTGAGMMDCKKALVESGGDLEGALDYLRKKGQKVAAKRADRDANEGVVAAAIEGDKGLLLALSCETDFVAKNDDFLALAGALAKLALENSAVTKEAVGALPFEGATVAEKLVERTGTIGEKIEVADVQTVEGKNIASYIHAGAKIGVLVAYNDGGKDDAGTFFRSIAMHIAAMSPSILHPNEFDADMVAKETESLQQQIKVENEDRARLSKALKTVPQFCSRLQLTDEVMAKAEADIKAELAAEGKPEKIWDKIVPGKLERFVADNTLLDQDRCLLAQFFALDDTKTVETAIKEFGAEAEVVAFKRVAVGT